MTGYLIFAIGCFVGAMLGILIMGLCVMSRDASTEIRYWPVSGADLDEFKRIVTGTANADQPGK
jgi:hypothetical protein